MYEGDDTKSISQMYHYYWSQHWTCCFLIALSLAIMCTGAIATAYGYFLPYLYTSLDSEEELSVKLADEVKMKKYKETFLIIGFSLIALGVFTCIFGACVPMWIDAQKSRRKRFIEHTPIAVDYELPPYDMSLEEARFHFVPDGNYPVACNGKTTPIVSEGDVYRTFLVQANLEN